MTIARRRIPSTSELITFESVARHASFTRAAQELSLTQGAISRQIKSLEERLDALLLERGARSVILTDVGTIFLTEARKLIEQLSDATEKAGAMGASQAFNLAVLPTFATRWLIPRLPRFLEKTPDVTINMLVRLEPFSFEEQRFDAAIHFGGGVWAGAEVHKLCREEVIPVAAPQLCARLKLATARDLDRATLLHQTTRPYAWEEWSEAFDVSIPGLRRGPRFEQFGMIIQAALSGIGVALLPRFMIESEISDGRLVALHHAGFDSGRAYWLAVPERKRSDRVVLNLLDWLRSEIRLT